jgi:hypothetical protein
MQDALQDAVDRIARRVPLPVSLTDQDLNSLVFGPHDEHAIDQVRRQSILTRTTEPWVKEWFFSHKIAVATGPIRIPSHIERGAASRVVIPVRRAGDVYGYLCLLDMNETFDLVDLDAIGEDVREIGRLLHDRDEQQSSDSAVLTDLLHGDETSRAGAATALHDKGLLPKDWVVTAIMLRVRTRGDDDDDRQLHLALSRLPGGHPRLSEPGATTVLVPTPAHSAHRAVQLAHGISTRADPSSGFSVGIGDPHIELSSAYLSHEQARRAAWAAAACPRFDGVAAWSDMGHLRALTLLNSAALADAVDPRLRALLAADDGTIRPTLHTYFDLGGDATAAASALTIHRGTLYYRLHKAESLADLVLSDSNDRIAVQVSLDVLRLLESNL